MAKAGESRSGWCNWLGGKPVPRLWRRNELVADTSLKAQKEE